MSKVNCDTGFTAVGNECRLYSISNYFVEMRKHFDFDKEEDFNDLMRILASLKG